MLYYLYSVTICYLISQHYVCNLSFKSQNAAALDVCMYFYNDIPSATVPNL